MGEALNSALCLMVVGISFVFEPILKILFACNCGNSAANGSSSFAVIQPLRLHFSSPFSLEFPQFRLKIIFQIGS